MKYLITGAAGFIGFHTAVELLSSGAQVIGVDNLNSYYDRSLKEARKAVLDKNSLFSFKELDISNGPEILKIFEEFKPDVVIHLAAQAGVRYSIDNPRSYVDSNLIGTFNILEACRSHRPKTLVYASSSSVYGANEKVPFSVDDRTDNPVSFYAATKKANEIMVASYVSLYKLNAVGLRFFTVYGPWGRPDMAYFSFTEKISQNKSIQLFNNGEMLRDFTYIDDIVQGILGVVGKYSNDASAQHKIYNLGNSRPEALSALIGEIERSLGMKAELINLPMQQGDVRRTFADIDASTKDFNYFPKVDLATGIGRFVAWYKEFRSHKK